MDQQEWWAHAVRVRVHLQRAYIRPFRLFEELVLLELLVGAWERAAVLTLPECLERARIDDAGVIREERRKLRVKPRRWPPCPEVVRTMQVLSNL